MATAYVNESVINIYDKIDHSELKKTDSSTDNCDTLETNSRNEVYQTLDFETSKQEVANVTMRLKLRKKAICAFRIILTVVVIATLVAVIISFTSTAEHVNEGWNSWTDWGSCSADCGIGMKIRNRTCTNSNPQGTGNYCQGQSVENALCFLGPCAKPSWSDWQNWSNCSAVVCGVSSRRRSRTCSNPSPALFVSKCKGNSTEIDSCRDTFCDINKCASPPCLHGSCSDLDTGLSCSCFAGYSGATCQTDIDDCASKPCLNGFCIDLVNGYNCSCVVGYTGLNCESDIDECRSDPCLGGTCIDGIGNYNCSCRDGYFGINCEKVLSDCFDIFLDGNSADGIYTVKTWKSQQLIKVYCDMTTDGGGWTVLQYRYDGTIDFYRNFSQYETGFGDLNTEFWLGLRYIQELASQSRTSLRIDLEAANGTKAFEIINNFSLSPGPAYTLHRGSTIQFLRISDISWFARHNGSDFSTYDHDVDSSTVNCAVDCHGAWWYFNCFTANLNGQYLTPGTKSGRGMVYNSFILSESLKTSKMMMRRK
ncbi:uncharacterized protein LOC128550874 [Mercenaria mercenaria]|uniref:uncharacterized protein LOC128550874 n=1 Tax=Mercenaria mercenaria TaxID=6596 RepID=UPI00234F9BC7|nr:uncharacterized protein LOC128550874 [Mercenaria mercenaria]